jgi:hypothetical protein
MKSFVSTLLLSGLAMAIPMAEKRAVATDVVVETVWTTTTVYIDGPSAANFAEHPHKTSSASSSSSVSAAPTSSAAPVAPTSPPYVAPVSTAAPYVAPAAPSPVAPAPAAAAPAAPAGNVVASGTGDATYYDVSVGATSCGGTYSNSQNVVALSLADMNNGANPNNNPLCGKTITITYGGASFTGTVVDSCQACAKGSIDLSQGFFPIVFPTGDGRVHGVSWTIS